MKQTTIHKCKDSWVVLRYEDNEKDWRTNGRTEYWTGSEWKPGLKNAKQIWHEDTAREVLVMLRVKGLV